MKATKGILRLAPWIVVLCFATTSFGSEAIDAPATQITYRDTQIVGREDSRYLANSPFWEVAERVRGDEASVTAPGFRFAWGDRSWHAAGAVAMAATVTLQQFVGLGDTHRTFCSGSRTCDMVNFETRQRSATFTVRRLLQGPGEWERSSAVRRCQESFPAFRDQLQTTLASSRGVVLAVYRAGAFGRPANGVENNNIHMFAMYGVDRDGHILIRDAADRVPVTYRIRAGSECEALTIPRGFSVSREAVSYRDWALTAWVVEPVLRQATLPPPVPPRPRPQPVPAPVPSPSPADDVPGIVGQDPFDLGAFRLPPPAPPSNHFVYPTAGGAPARLQLRTGVAPASARQSQQVLTRLQETWGVSRVGQSIRYRPRAGERGPLNDAYRVLGKSERAHLAGLARKFEVAARRLGKDRVWLATSVIRFVQNIPYELIHEDAMGLRAPVSVLSRNGGDCDSKSLLAAILLRMLGFESIVLTNDRLSHAVLGVELPGSSGVYARHGSRRFTLVESTTPSAIGDLSFWGTHGDALQSGWEVHDVEI